HALLLILRCAAEVLHDLRSSCRPSSHRIVLGFGDKCTEHKMVQRRASTRQSALSGRSNNRVEHAIRRLRLSGHAFRAEDYPTHMREAVKRASPVLGMELEGVTVAQDLEQFGPVNVCRLQP